MLLKIILQYIPIFIYFSYQLFNENIFYILGVSSYVFFVQKMTPHQRMIHRSYFTEVKYSRIRVSCPILYAFALNKLIYWPAFFWHETDVIKRHQSVIVICCEMRFTANSSHANMEPNREAGPFSRVYDLSLHSFSIFFYYFSLSLSLLCSIRGSTNIY